MEKSVGMQDEAGVCEVIPSDCRNDRTGVILHSSSSPYRVTPWTLLSSTEYYYRKLLDSCSVTVRVQSREWQ